MTGKKKKMDKGKLNRNTKNNESIQIKTNSISLFENIFGFNFNDIKTYENVCRLAYRPTDPSSIGVMRAFFGKSTAFINNVSLISIFIFIKEYI